MSVQASPFACVPSALQADRAMAADLPLFVRPHYDTRGWQSDVYVPSVEAAPVDGSVVVFVQRMRGTLALSQGTGFKVAHQSEACALPAVEVVSVSWLVAAGLLALAAHGLLKRGGA